jgi:superfamily II DNA/RNA helicase
MLDMGFIPDVERIVSLLSKIRQTLLFSATMAPEVRRLADAFLMNPKEITVSPPATTATNVTQGIIVVDELDKREALRRLIRKEEVTNALIFCNRKKDVDILYRSLVKHGFDAVQLHGDMPQSKRTETLEKFKNNEARLMVCSDVAARGLDIKGLSHVFNFDTPFHAEDYVHRIGRTGRAGREGRAFTFAMPEDGKSVQAIEKLIGKPIPHIEIEGISTQQLSDEPRRRGRGRGGKPARESQGGREAGRDESRGRRGRGTRRNGHDRDQAPRDTQVEAPQALAKHRKEDLAAATALPEIAPQMVAAPTHLEAIQPIRPVTPESGNRHQRRAHHHAETHRGSHHDDEAGIGSGPFGDHTPEFFARDQRRYAQSMK